MIQKIQSLNGAARRDVGLWNYFLPLVYFLRLKKRVDIVFFLRQSRRVTSAAIRIWSEIKIQHIQVITFKLELALFHYNLDFNVFFKIKNYLWYIIYQ